MIKVSHPNLCGFGKALLEACMEGQVKELVLVNCCDTIRSAYDDAAGKRKTGFYLYAGHASQYGRCSGERTRNELLRLAKAYGAYMGTAF